MSVNACCICGRKEKSIIASKTNRILCKYLSTAYIYLCKNEKSTIMLHIETEEKLTHKPNNIWKQKQSIYLHCIYAYTHTYII